MHNFDHYDQISKQRQVNLSQNIFSEDGKSEMKSTNRNPITDSFHVNDLKNELNDFSKNEEIEKDIMNDYNNTLKKKQNLKSFLEDSKLD